MWSKRKKFSTWRWTWWRPMSSFHRRAFTTALRTSYCWILDISRSESAKLDTGLKNQPTQNCVTILLLSLSIWAFWVVFQRLHLKALEIQSLNILMLLSFQMSSQSKKHLPQLSAFSSNIEDIMSRAYDCFDIQLSSLQLLYSKPGTHDTRACACQRLFECLFKILFESREAQTF